MWSLKIGGIERFMDLDKKSLTIEAALTYQIDTCSFKVRGAQVAEGEEVIIEDGIDRKFAGIVTKVQLDRTSPSKKLVVWKVDCDDYSYLADKDLVVEIYENMSGNDIFADIITKYCPDFTTNGIQSNAPVIEFISFDYKRPSECFREICEYVGWHWYVDYYKNIYFFHPDNLSSPAPMKLIPGGNFRFGRHTINTQGLANYVIVRGGTMLSDPLGPIEWKADGTARTWTLPFPPHDLTLQVGGIAKTVGEENVDEDESQFDYMFNFKEKYIRCSNHTPTPVKDIILSIYARQDIPVDTEVENIESQQAIAAVQGGNGVYKHVIVDDSLTTLDAAYAAGDAYLREWANPKVNGNFETEVEGWKPGQLVEINLPDRGVVGTFLVQRLTITPSIRNYWTTQVEYGGRLIGIADYLQALVSAQQKKKLANTRTLNKVKVFREDTAEVTDSLTATARKPAYYCGDADAICGFVECLDTDYLLFPTENLYPAEDLYPGQV